MARILINMEGTTIHLNYWDILKLICRKEITFGKKDGTVNAITTRITTRRFPEKSLDY